MRIKVNGLQVTGLDVLILILCWVCFVFRTVKSITLKSRHPLYLQDLY